MERTVGYIKSEQKSLNGNRAYKILGNVTVVTHPHSYYVFTTFDGLNLPRFATFCLFCDCFNNLIGNYIPGKLRQNRAN